MTALVLAIFFTLGVSGFCSLLEAFILSTTAAEVEDLKSTHLHRGRLLERFKLQIDRTSAAILTLNTIANTLGATLVGALAAAQFAGHPSEKMVIALLSGGLVLGILILSEILPKNVGVIYRVPLRPYLVYPLQVVRIAMYPFTILARVFLRAVLPQEETNAEAEAESQEREIILLAEKSAKEGGLSQSERDMISNALSLDDVRLSAIMTPRTVVFALEADMTVEEVLEKYRNVPFGRVPVYDEDIETIVGLIRRRDVLQASSADEEAKTLRSLMGDILFAPENTTAADCLQLFLKKHQQFAVVVDEYGSMVGVVTMEDIVEHILGREIYEESDVAVDMRKLARERANGPREPARQQSPKAS